MGTHPGYLVQEETRIHGMPTAVDVLHYGIPCMLFSHEYGYALMNACSMMIHPCEQSIRHSTCRVWCRALQDGWSEHQTYDVLVMVHVTSTDGVDTGIVYAARHCMHGMNTYSEYPAGIPAMNTMWDTQLR